MNNGTPNMEQSSVNLACQVDGTFVPSLFNYTCTLDCPAPPPIDSSVMQYNWNSSAALAPIGTNVV
jgi:hypothetical protein